MVAVLVTSTHEQHVVDALREPGAPVPQLVACERRHDRGAERVVDRVAPRVPEDVTEEAVEGEDEPCCRTLPRGERVPLVGPVAHQVLALDTAHVERVGGLAAGAVGYGLGTPHHVHVDRTQRLLLGREVQADARGVIHHRVHAHEEILRPREATPDRPTPLGQRLSCALREPRQALAQPLTREGGVLHLILHHFTE